MRLSFIDILKGFTIIWVLWMHMDLPEIIYPSVQMPIFFFISGLFYHAKAPTLWQQIKSDSYRLLLPVLMFSLLAYVVGIAKDTIEWNGSISDYINTILSSSIVWFLIALFYFRSLAYPCVKRHKPIYVLLAALLIYIPGFYLYANHHYWILPFLPLSHMGVFMIWFAIGLLFGKRILNLITEPQIHTTGVCVLLAITYLLIVHNLDWNSGLLGKIPWLIYGFPYTLGIIFLMLLGAYGLEKIETLRPVSKTLTYVGQNSIVFYLTHWPLWMYVFKPYDFSPVYMSFCCIVILEFPLIYIFNRYMPWYVGKPISR